MRRHSLAMLFAGMLLFLLAPAAGAASQTVAGQGDIEKMYANNGDKGITVKLFGLEKPCGGTQYMNVQVKWGDKEAYEVDGACVSGSWGYDLFYLADRSNPEGSKKKSCDGLKVSYNKDKGFLKTYIPRSCIPKANNKVKIQSEGHNFGTMTGGSAGPTKLLAKG